MKTKFNENDKLTVKAEFKQIHGLSVVTVKPGDALRCVGIGRFGEVVCRFEDCSNTPTLHDVFFGLIYVDADNAVSLQQENTWLIAL